MKQYQITGLGPVNADGSRKIFTRLPAPFIVTAAWLAAQQSDADVGEWVEVADDGTLTLQQPPTPQAVVIPPDVEPAQKKSDTSGESGMPSLAEFSRYKGKPVIVHASEITGTGILTSDGYLEVTLAGGAVREATPEMLARMTPVVGDYWVIAPQDGVNYEYLNPKAVFEHKYELMEPEITV